MKLNQRHLMSLKQHSMIITYLFLGQTQQRTHCNEHSRDFCQPISSGASIATNRLTTALYASVTTTNCSSTITTATTAVTYIINK